jgi:hypothetical protein
MKPKNKSKSTKLSPTAQKAHQVDQDSTDSTKAIVSLCSRSRTALEEGDPNVALELANRACSLLPKGSTNVHPLELVGEITVELGEFERARELFVEAAKRRENVPTDKIELGEEGKFAWLGQMSTAEEAEKWYLRAIDTLKILLEKSSDDIRRKIIHRKICVVYCSLVELFLTDLWYQSLPSR